MGIEITKTNASKNGMISGESNFIEFIKALISAYEWYSAPTSECASSDEDKDFYITENLYIRVHGGQLSGTYANITISLCGPFGTKRAISSMQIVGSNDGRYVFFSWAFGKTENGFAFKAKSQDNSYDTTLNFNFYIGDYSFNGQTAKGCIYSDDSGNITVATAKGTGTMSALGTTINADRKAVLSPVVNTATGETFNDIFIMRYSPVQYGAMEVEGKGVFLCGKTLCIKDTEGV